MRLSNLALFKTEWLIGQQCGGPRTATVTPQLESTPGHPNNNYPSNLNCTWTITAPPGYMVQIEFQDLSVETCCDYILIGKPQTVFHSTKKLVEMTQAIE